MWLLFHCHYLALPQFPIAGPRLPHLEHRDPALEPLGAHASHGSGTRIDLRSQSRAPNRGESSSSRISSLTEQNLQHFERLHLQATQSSGQSGHVPQTSGPALPAGGLLPATRLGSSHRSSRESIRPAQSPVQERHADQDTAAAIHSPNVQQQPSIAAQTQLPRTGHTFSIAQIQTALHAAQRQLPQNVGGQPATDTSRRAVGPQAVPNPPAAPHAADHPGLNFTQPGIGSAGDQFAAGRTCSDYTAFGHLRRDARPAQDAAMGAAARDSFDAAGAAGSAYTGLLSNRAARGSDDESSDVTSISQQEERRRRVRQEARQQRASDGEMAPNRGDGKAKMSIKGFEKTDLGTRVDTMEIEGDLTGVVPHLFHQAPTQRQPINPITPPNNPGSSSGVQGQSHRNN